MRDIINYRSKEKDIFIIYAVFLALCTYLVYQQYIDNGDLFAVLQGDMYAQTVPELQGILTVIQQGEFPMWSFYKGLGQQITTGNPMGIGDLFLLIPLLIFQDNFVVTLGLTAALKTLLSGIIFYCFLRELHISSYTCCIISMFYAFNGHMICRGMWIHYATEVVFVALWLLALERFYRGKKRLFPVVLALLLISRAASYIYIYSLLTFFYILMRTLFDEGVQPKKIMRNIILLIPYYLIGVGLSAFLVLPGLLNIFQSSRLGTAPTDLFGLGDLKLIASAYLKLFSNAMIGYDVPSNYLNVLEDPATYAGILSVLVVPQIFCIKTGKVREKITLISAVSLAALYYIFRFVPYFCNAFSTSLIKLSSFWQIIVVLLAAAYVLNKIETGEFQINKFVFVITGLIHIFILVLICVETNHFVEKRALAFAILVIVLYLFITVAGIPKGYKNYMIVAVCILEAVGGANEILSTQASLKNGSLENRRAFYQNEQYQGAIDSINDNSFYRVSNNFSSNMHNRSQSFGYYGVGSYVSVQPAAQKELYDFFDIDYPHLNTFSDFTVSNTNLASLLGVKYYVHDPMKGGIIPSGFVPYSSYENMEIYINENALPFGVVFYQYSLEENWDQGQLMQSIALDTVPESHQLLDAEIQEFDVDVEIGDTKNLIPKEMFTTEKMEYSSLSNDPVIYMTLQKDETDPIDTYKISFSATSNIDTIGQVFYWNENTEISEEKSKIFTVDKGTKEYSVVVTGDIDNIRLDIGTAIGEFRIEEFKIAGYTNTVTELMESAMEIDQFSNNKISGSIQLEKPGFVLFPILNVDGWKIYVDGIEQEILNADGALMACALPAGEHTLELTYVTPGLLVGTGISCVSLILYGFVFFRKNEVIKVV